MSNISQSARVKHRLHNGAITGLLWCFKTDRFAVYWETERSNEKYDGDDVDGSIQRDLDSGDLIMFDSKVYVEFDGVEIASDYLGCSVYDPDKVKDFIGDGYFRDMVRNACEQAREFIRKSQIRMRY